MSGTDAIHGAYPGAPLPIWNVHIDLEGAPESFLVVFHEPVPRVMALDVLNRIEYAMRTPTVGELSLTHHAAMIPDDRGDVLLVPLRHIRTARVVRVEEP